MKISVLTLFPDFINNIGDFSIVGRSIGQGKLELETVDIRDFAINKYLQVDDYPYGGGPGMLMQIKPIVEAIESVKTENSKVYYMSPQGKVLTQDKLKELKEEEHIILLNGHYEGIDNRVIENYVDEEISIGDYVLTGGELASMVIIDGVSRLLDGVLASEESFEDESHYNGLLEHPQYTRPREFRGLEVPDILLSGDHEKIRKYRLRESIKNTLQKRPDLLKDKTLNDEEKDILKDLLEGGKDNGLY
ncbi:tRNA (guanosine(37)-N1)-methyltransferase TrmD [Peptoniphilus harei]|uniref:tRNA (guanosine(37)-N1)-methyltransferase TrmD n=1 Tax=Peptoniphilus harei TaxID=54005 RepID=UPI0025515778|nr:tRNA (guanosine(37)-N1)-methyltransferase TrmD [Peptoniphilus harei]MDK7355090.1 tRNA (guanosine(37)-N1)-methyltransferase TrmD [Peptoniphilus harei]MDK7370798.1 tRNA (guanosine(37)-N1)-methyltransferase TrmD [Peptoniphilus harei]